MKYINKLALLALAALGFGLQAVEPVEADTAAMGEPTESSGWSLPSATQVGLGTLGAGAAGLGGYALGKSGLDLYNAQKALEAAAQERTDWYNQMAGSNIGLRRNYNTALQNLEDLEARGYLGRAQDAVMNLWNPQVEEKTVGARLKEWINGPKSVVTKTRNFFGAPAGTPGTPEFASSFDYQAPVAPWYSPIMNAPSAISSRWGALDPYSKVGAALAGAALLGGGLYGANRLYQRYRGGEMPAIEAALTEAMTDEQIAQNLQNKEILNILLTMADLINGEGVGMKASNNTDRLARLHDYINALNAVNFATTELTSMVNNLEAEFKAARARDFSAVGKRDKRNKIIGMYRSLSNLLSDQIRNLRK